MANTFVINVGGSLLSPSEQIMFDFTFAESLKELINKFPEDKFVFCVGGGSITRKYQQLLSDNNVGVESQHEIGVALINVNAVMLKGVLGDLAEEKILRYEDFNDESPLSFNKRVLISAAGAVGHSSDWNTIKLAIRAEVDKVYSLSNIDGVYNKNPKEFTDAERLPELKWQEYLDIIGNPVEHKPGAKYPVDPFASKLGMEKGIKFYVLSNSIINLEDAIKGPQFIGSVIY